MGELRLIEPNRDYADQVMSYREAFLACGEPLVGCGSLEEAADFDDWLQRELLCGRVYGGPLVYLALRKSDRKIVGMIEYWPMQTAYVLAVTGSLRFSVLPAERGKGYATEMLEKMVGKCWELGSEQLTLLCARNDPASSKVIERNGGVLADFPSDGMGEGPADDRLRYRLPTREIQEEQDDIDC